MENFFVLLLLLHDISFNISRLGLSLKRQDAGALRRHRVRTLASKSLVSGCLLWKSTFIPILSSDTDAVSCRERGNLKKSTRLLTGAMEGTGNLTL